MSENIVSLYRASDLPGKPVPESTIHISACVDEVRCWDNIEGAREFYNGQADILLQALSASLPQGTIDALLVRLLDHKRSTLMVAYDKR